jgi:hypothetical protein
LKCPAKLYPGVKTNVWFYVPAQWDGVTPLAVQVWGDGQNFTGSRPDQWRVLETLDNLTAQKRIPLMVNIFVQPGTGFRTQPAIHRIRHCQRHPPASPAG